MIIAKNHFIKDYKIVIFCVHHYFVLTGFHFLLKTTVFDHLGLFDYYEIYREIKINSSFLNCQTSI